MSHTDNSVALQMAEFCIECWIVGHPFGNVAPERLSTPAFLMTVGFSFALHWQCGHIKVLTLEHAVQCAAGTLYLTGTPAGNHMLWPALKKATTLWTVCRARQTRF